MKLFDLYRAYFKHQAKNHPDLLHSDASGGRVFEVISVDEAIGDLRTSGKEKDFILRLLDYTYEVSDDTQSQIRKYIQGGFIVAKYHSPRSGGKESYYTAMEESERVMDELIAKMIADSQNGHPLFFHSLDSRQNITVNPLVSTEDGTYSGWICFFRFAPHFPECVAEGWLDDGLTPNDLLEEEV